MIKNNWFFAAFLFVACYAFYGFWFDACVPELNGFVEAKDEVVCSIDSVMDGSYQNYINDYWNDNFPGRKMLIRFRNQMLYSLCSEAPNTNVIIGEDKYLFGTQYVGHETQIIPPEPEEYFLELGEKLERLERLLEDNEKELYIFITPSKAYFLNDKISGIYKIIERLEKKDISNYERLVNELQNRNLNYFDSINYIENNKEKYMSPVFYKSGIHWSCVWGESSAAEFLKYMKDIGKYDLDEIQVTEKEVFECIYPNSDYYDSLNLCFPPDEKWYRTDISIVEDGNDKPNVFYRGGSFMGQSINMLIQNNVFSKNIHFENNFCYTDNYRDVQYLSSFTAYDELNLDKLVGQSDILILEVNDAAISDMSWGFVDYLLDHVEYLDKIY